MSSIHQSGNSLYMRRMKYGNKLRWILIQTANTAASVVNKMITILWYMLVNKNCTMDGYFVIS